MIFFRTYWYVVVLLVFALIAAVVGVGDVLANNDYSSFIFAGICVALALIAYLLAKRFG